MEIDDNNNNSNNNNHHHPEDHLYPWFLVNSKTRILTKDRRIRQDPISFAMTVVHRLLERMEAKGALSGVFPVSQWPRGKAFKEHVLVDVCENPSLFCRRIVEWIDIILNLAWTYD